ncbi:hypothetical protein Absy_008_131 [Acetobacter syzygii]|nr:hypothetical protein Absy_008_131 [Acetobacter syzygii]
MLGLDRAMCCLSPVCRCGTHTGGKLSGNRGICHVMDPLDNRHTKIKNRYAARQGRMQTSKKILLSDYGMVMP